MSNALPLSPLSPSDKKDFAALEKIVQKGVKSFLEVGKALLQIHSRKLYREKYTSWEGYLEERWNLSRSHGYRLVHAGEVAENLSHARDTIEMPGRLVEQLAKLPPDEQRRIFAQAQAAAPASPVSEVRNILAGLTADAAAKKVRADEENAKQALPPRGQGGGVSWRGAIVRLRMACERVQESADAAALIGEVLEVVKPLHACLSFQSELDSAAATYAAAVYKAAG
jgi:hypothetical protein